MVVDICIWAEQFPELNALPRFRLRASLQPCVKKSSDMKQLGLPQRRFES